MDCFYLFMNNLKCEFMTDLFQIKIINFHQSTRKMFFFTTFIIFASILSSNKIYGRMDDDTEVTNNSFDGLIQQLHGEFEPCNIKLNGKYEKATARVQPRFQMPTCLKTFYNDAFLSGCGMPLFPKFKYCAKALFYKNRDIGTFNMKDFWKDKRQILVLVDGCLRCPKYSDRTANVTIQLFSGFPDEKDKPLATTHSDRFSDFKIGAIVNMKNKGKKFLAQIRPYMEIVHYCNQYHVEQKKTVNFPILQAFQMENLVFVAPNSAIYLPQRDIDEITVDL